MLDMFILAWLTTLSVACLLLIVVCIFLYRKMMSNHFSYMECRRRINLITEHGDKIGIKYRLPSAKKPKRLEFDLTKLEPLDSDISERIDAILT